MKIDRPAFSVRAALLATALPAVASCAPPETSGAPSADPLGWSDRAEVLHGATVRDRFLEATEILLGTPYRGGPLGEGDAGGPDPDPRVDFTGVDCVTYLEESLALALLPPGAPATDSTFLAILDAIRYRDGMVSFASRNHYTVTDWMDANRWLVRDVTREIGGSSVEEATRTIDRTKFLRDQGVEPRGAIDAPLSPTIGYVPVAALPEVAPRIESGDLVFWVGSTPGIFVLHTGLAVRTADGTLRFRHASSRAGEAVEQPLMEYAAGTKFLGVVVLRMLESPVIPARSPE
ncbi:MAG: DUF1460 domain-containing protein [Gemmatimonadetes bacterium]|nr:DUF1460 domain-containing protein [Gemmatimonadota bacterium]